MLLEIRVRNFAVIDAVTVSLQPGLNVLTGETGAGKSMLLDAILLIRGARAQTDVIRTDTETATVEAVFEVAPRRPVAAALDEAAPSLDQAQLVIRRELAAARLRAGEEDELRGDRRRLQHAERLSAGLAEAAGLLNDDDSSAMSRLHRTARLLRDLARLDPAFAAPADSVEGAGALIEDALAAVRSLRNSIAMAPGRLEAIDERLDALTRLKRKYGDTEAAMLVFRDEAASELEHLGRHEEILAEQERMLGELDAELSGGAHELAKRRHDAAERFAG